MQVGAGGQARRADVADHLSPAYPLTHARGVTGEMVVGGDHGGASHEAVRDDHPVAVTDVVVAPDHTSARCGPHRPAAAGTEVGPVVEPPGVVDRVQPHAVRRGDVAVDGSGQRRPARARGLLGPLDRRARPLLAQLRLLLVDEPGDLGALPAQLR